MSNMLQNRKNVRFRFSAGGISLVVVLVMISSMEAVSVPKGCTEVATYGQKWIMTGDTVIEIKQLVNFIDCIKELYKIYKTTDWKIIHSMVPQKMRDVIRKVPNLGKNVLAVAKREGLCFVSVYFLYRAVDLYDQAMNLAVDYKIYRKEFEWLQRELQPVIYLIHEELLPNWEQLNIAVLRKITGELNDKLSRYHAELKQLVRAIRLDIKKGLSGRRWAAGFTLGSFALSVASVFVGNVPGAISASIAGFTNLASVESLTLTIQKLESLENDVEVTCIEIEEYRFLLQQKLLRSEIFDYLFIFLFVVSVIVLFSRNH